MPVPLEILRERLHNDTGTLEDYAAWMISAHSSRIYNIGKRLANLYEQGQRTRPDSPLALNQKTEADALMTELEEIVSGSRDAWGMLR